MQFSDKYKTKIAFINGNVSAIYEKQPWLHLPGILPGETWEEDLVKE